MNVKKLKKVKLNLVLTRPVQDLVSWLLGQELLLGIPAQTTFDSAKIENADDILALLHRMEYVVGNPREWYLSTKVYTEARHKLTEKQPGMSLQNRPTAPPAVLTLANAFKEHLGAFPRERQGIARPGLFVAMRRLSHKFPPDLILKEIPRFAKIQKLSPTGIYSIPAFERFLGQHKKGL